MANGNETPVDPADPGDRPTQRADPDDFPTVRGLKAGQMLFGRYVLESELGAGGMDVVWRARDAELGEPVALKFLPEVVARDAAAVDELKDETRHARRLTHPNIVRIHQFEREGLIAAVSMEFVDGTTLSHLRLQQPGKVFGVGPLAPLVTQLCAALDYAHIQAKIVHRNLKPANILVTSGGAVKVTDFGIARSLSESFTRLTGKGGDTSGTLPYMSPQQLLGKKARATDDIYALGATLYELLTGRPPFFTGDIARQVQSVTPPPVAERRSELGIVGEAIPAGWEETIATCLEKDPTQRPQTAGDVARRLGIAGYGTENVGSDIGRAVGARDGTLPADGKAPQAKAPSREGKSVMEPPLVPSEKAAPAVAMSPKGAPWYQGKLRTWRWQYGIGLCCTLIFGQPVMVRATMRVVTQRSGGIGDAEGFLMLLVVVSAGFAFGGVHRLHAAKRFEKHGIKDLASWTLGRSLLSALLWGFYLTCFGFLASGSVAFSVGVAAGVALPMLTLAYLSTVWIPGGFARRCVDMHNGVSDSSWPPVMADIASAPTQISAASRAEAAKAETAPLKGSEAQKKNYTRRRLGRAGAGIPSILVLAGNRVGGDIR